MKTTAQIKKELKALGVEDAEMELAVRYLEAREW